MEKVNTLYTFYDMHPVHLLILANVVLLGVFALIYFIINKVDSKAFNYSFNIPLNFIDMVYFAIATHTTVGYGDIVPAKTYAKIIVCVHMMLVLFLNLGLVWMSIHETITDVHETIKEVHSRL